MLKHPTDHAGLEILSFDRCLQLLATVPVGRISFFADGEIVVLPVNFAMDSQAPVFRHGPRVEVVRGGKTRTWWPSRPTNMTREPGPDGASWLPAALKAVYEDEEVERLGQLRRWSPWVSAEDRPFWIRIRPSSISGRQTPGRGELHVSSTVVNAKTCEISQGQMRACLRSWVRAGPDRGQRRLRRGRVRRVHGARRRPAGAGLPAAGRRVATGRSVTTIEGLAGSAGEPLHPVQRALIAERASQCGYCTPGIALRAAALLAAHPDPGDGQIAAALDPCLCRCGCYPRIVRAVHRAAALARGEDEPAEPGP